MPYFFIFFFCDVEFYYIVIAISYCLIFHYSLNLILYLGLIENNFFSCIFGIIYSRGHHLSYISTISFNVLICSTGNIIHILYWIWFTICLCRGSWIKLFSNDIADGYKEMREDGREHKSFSSMVEKLHCFDLLLFEI